MSASDHPGTRKEGAATPPTGQAAVICPFCGSDDTEPLALFGSQLSTTQHYCRACHTPFERMKQDTPPRDRDRDRDRDLQSPPTAT